jgi:hypothetical protein
MELVEVFEAFSVKEVAEKCGTTLGTVKRWVDRKEVPKQYQFEIMKMLGIPIDYSQFTHKDKDQFFTPKDTANHIFDCFKKNIANNGEDINDFFFIEPAAGDGVFLDILPKNNMLALDIEPRNEMVVKGDFLAFIPENKGKTVVFGNPPFGLRGNLALKFINHSAKFADYVAFILPQLFESDGKGVPRKRVKGLNLIHSEKINPLFLMPDNSETKVNCVFQIWSKHHKNPSLEYTTEINENIKIYSVSDGDSPGKIRNKKMFYKCDIFLQSTCFGEENMTYYECFDDLPRKKGYGVVFLKNKTENLKKFKEIDWKKVAFLSTNSALNLRSSQIYGQFK